MPETRTVETIEELKALVGQELGVGPWYLITQPVVDAYAEISDDHQWIHVDPERAATSPFGGTIAHGLLVLSLLPRLQRDREGVRIELPRKMVVFHDTGRGSALVRFRPRATAAG